MQISLQLIPEQPHTELLEAVTTADRLGYYACYSADEIYHKDPWLLLAAAAEHTGRLRLGPCVAPIYMREPTYVAQLAATLDELSGGRAEVVFGIGNIAMLEQHGRAWRGTRPIARLREAHAVMRTLLDEGAIDFAGDFYSYTGVTTTARPVQSRLPLKIGAMGGPRSRELAGELADGLHTACAYSSQALEYARSHFAIGAERSGRDPSELDLADSLLGAIAPDRASARRAGRLLAAFYIPSMPPQLLERHDIDPDSVAAVNDAFAAGDVEGALARTPAEVADRLVLAGDADAWVEWIHTSYRPLGFEHALVSFADNRTLEPWAGRTVDGLPTLVEQVRLVGERVIPRLA